MNCSDPDSVVCASLALKDGIFVQLFLFDAVRTMHFVGTQRSGTSDWSETREKKLFREKATTNSKCWKKWMHSPCGTKRTKWKNQKNKSRCRPSTTTGWLLLCSAALHSILAASVFFSPVRCLKTTRAYTRNKNWNCGVAASNQNPQGISRRQRTVRRWRIAHILAQLFAAQKAKSILFHFYWRAVCYLRQMEIDFCVRISHLSSHRRQTECERWRCRHYVDCLINLSVASFSWLHKNRLLIQNNGDNIAIWNEKTHSLQLVAMRIEKEKY